MDAHGQKWMETLIAPIYFDLMFDQNNGFQSFSGQSNDGLLYIWKSWSPLRRRIFPLRLHFLTELPMSG